MTVYITSGNWDGKLQVEYSDASFCKNKIHQTHRDPTDTMQWEFVTR